MFIFFVSIGFDLCEVGQEEVILKTGKQANRRTMHFALQALLALFGKSSTWRHPTWPPGATGMTLIMVWEEEELSERTFLCVTECSSKQTLCCRGTQLTMSIHVVYVR